MYACNIHGLIYQSCFLFQFAVFPCSQFLLPLTEEEVDLSLGFYRRLWSPLTHRFFLLHLLLLLLLLLLLQKAGETDLLL
jgi:hypothetical protein